MSDKSKLGFNINPKNYDELNSTDNLITSGSDSGWLGKKLQGGDSNDLDLSKINPLFDKELYERYRPGVNTNDGSVNQDIWGYKCFNSPVSFRNGIYGDTYSITENKSSDELINLIPETYATIRSDTTVKNKIYNRTDNDTNNYYEYTYNDYSGVVDYDYSKFAYFENVFHDHNEHTITDSNIDSHIESRSHGLFATNDLSERTLCSVIPKVYNGVTYEGAEAQYVYSVNYASSQYERKLQAYTPKADYKIPLPSGDEHITEEIKEENTTAILSMSAESPYILEHDDEVKLGSNIRLETISEQYDSDGTSNKRSASIEISSPKHDCYIYGPSVNVSAKMDNNTGKLNIMPGVIFIEANANASAYICIDGEDDSITLYAGKINLPSTIVTHAKALSKEINSANYIYATDNSILPSNDSVISLGSNSYKYSNIYANRLIGIASAAEKLVYVNPTNNAETELLTVSNENLILPRGNNTIQLGSTDNRFGTIYGDLNGTAVLADHAGTAEQATKDQYGNIIASSYLNTLEFGRNDIESYNAIIGNEKDKLLFLKEKYFGTNADIPPKNKSYVSIRCAFTDTLTSYKTIISWSNEAEDNPITKLCHVDYNLAYNDITKKHSFYFMPNGVASDDPKYVESMNIGAPNAPWDNIYCKNFPTIAGTTDTTSVGNIRLLCIKGPAGLTTIEHEIKHGSIIKNPMQIGGKQFTIHIANLRIVDNSQNFIGVTGEYDTVEGEWQLLSSALVVANSPSIAVFTPVLAMRVL